MSIAMLTIGIRMPTLANLRGGTAMRNPTDNKKTCDNIATEADVLVKLEHEQRTAQRQQLLKILWKLAKTSGAEPYLSAEYATIRSKAKRDILQTRKEQPADLSISH
jgi:Holliday junction resolvase